MRNIILKIKNAYLYAYYECYLQQHYYYRDHRNKNFYSITTLGAVIGFLLIFPSVIFFGNKFNIGKLMYVFLIIIAYSHIFLTSKLVGGDKDLTEDINAFYAEKKIVKESKRIVFGFVILCVLFWVWVIMYGNE